MGFVPLSSSVVEMWNTLLEIRKSKPTKISQTQFTLPPVPSTFQLPSILSNASSIEPALTRVLLAAEPVHPYTIPALRPSGYVLVHPNTLLPPVPSTFQLPSIRSNASSVEPALTRVLLATEPVHPYTIPALRPSGYVLVHPNMLNGFGFHLSSNPPSFRPTDSPFQGSAPQ
ncbi:hypothetical protein PAXINDRAFT_20943 [Paxillus involutus ATCC 200175]|uniref:Unplaced genomic scaffold PAXINscaffold_1369, whole genome shotgun sequence n=1 Tax=Paxillus involutus ATCC 200175 TaxID=664439 RepID=A0A0C9TC93_PAXIN|nr:hypothetical protein PAXINDRAFT_20943 [Paxillus involutus ATCC 200175]